ncbi:PQQ-dependent sugar dehydrogenase [Schlesneria sp. DSM 10557]|uniref:PQQ-dependent sugar dehydrogenase n=1 Tax=Schlesneria sp. DSM 10557 TaxID=3044399 RepID=UPI0035A19E8A
MVRTLVAAIIGIVYLAPEWVAAEHLPTGKRVSRWGDEGLPKLTTSRVTGSPEPPLPYTTQRVYPQLKINFPVSIIHQPGSDRLWTITFDGPSGTTLIRRFVDSADVTELETVIPSEPGNVATDVLFHPQFEQNGYVFIGHNEPVTAGGEKYCRISRYKVNPRPPYEVDVSSKTTIIEWPSDGHNGVAMAFGLDGMFYVTSGDGTSDSDTNLRGQEMSHLTAKVLRIDIEHPEEGKHYSVPGDNPFVGRDGIAPETWAFGLRNPWRMTVDRQTGHLWVGNNGQDLWEQVYFVRKGDNYGWSVFEGSYPFYLERQLGPAPYVKPTLEHHHSEARSLTGGIVYYGQKLPELRGAYIYGDHSTGKIWGARHDGTNVLWHRELVDTPFHIPGFGTDSKGEFLVADYAGNGEGGFYTLIPTPPPDNTVPFPRTLSESGLFESVKGHIVQPALIPYDVNAPLWSDGAGKARFIAIPGDSSRIEITGARGWNFPDDTVIVKSFSLDFIEGDPNSRRWIETRFLTKQQNEWVGYSYRWNEEQTDAALVSQEGMDQEFTIKTAEGTRQQVWHYPSRAECMVCHSRAAGFVLGLSTGQMNRSAIDLPLHAGASSEPSSNGTSASANGDLPLENQLEMLQRLGLLKLDKTPAELERLVNPYDEAAPLELRAKSYLHANCANCHVEAGGGNSQIQLEFVTALDQMKVIDAVPVHDKFGLPDARIVAPGHPERSVILQRVAKRGRGQMPQLATSLVDQPAVEMLSAWIKSLTMSSKTTSTGE